MRLKLTIQGTEPEIAIEVHPDRPAAIGRSANADFSYPEDNYMSGRHFEARLETSGWQVKDLGSSNGLFLNGEKIAESALKPGDELRAGSTVFEVEFVDDMPKPPPLLAVEALQAEPHPAYAVIDAAASSDLYQLILDNPERCISLFEGTPLEEYEDDGPHVVQLGDDESFLLSFVYAGWEANAAVYLTSGAGFEALAGHLKSLLLAKTEDGERLLFRYYDPRVLRAYLPTCTAAELAEFFGPVETLYAEVDATQWQKLSRGPEGLQADPLDFLPPADGRGGEAP